MRISTKGRYGLAVMLCLAEKTNISQTVIDISEKLGVSKIYLEQVFSLLKNAGLIQSIKGSQGGYFLNASPSNITVFDVMKATESSLFEATEKSITGKSEHMEAVLQDYVWQPLATSLQQTLSSVSLQDLLDKSKNDFMFYI